MSEFWNKLVEGGKTATDVIKSLYNVLATCAVCYDCTCRRACSVPHCGK